MNRVLMEAIAYLAAYLGLELRSDMEERDPNPDKTEFENLVATLRKLTPQEREDFAQYLEELAAHEESRPYRGSMAEFFSSFAKSFREEHFP